MGAPYIGVLFDSDDSNDVDRLGWMNDPLRRDGWKISESFNVITYECFKFAKS
jgi:hypothetical protein